MRVIKEGYLIDPNGDPNWKFADATTKIQKYILRHCEIPLDQYAVYSTVRDVLENKISTEEAADLAVSESLHGDNEPIQQVRTVYAFAFNRFCHDDQYGDNSLDEAELKEGYEDYDAACIQAKNVVKSMSKKFDKDTIRLAFKDALK